MSNPFLGEIRLVPYAFSPVGWSFAAGQLLPISQNTALFSLMGTTYGGNGKSNFAIPDLQGNVAIGSGQGPGLSFYDLGQQAGSQTITLLQTEMPSHNHTMNSSAATSDVNSPGGNSLSKPKSTVGNMYGTPPTNPGQPPQLNPGVVSISGGNLPHNNMMPFLGLNWIIAFQGVFPARS